MVWSSPLATEGARPTPRGRRPCSPARRSVSPYAARCLNEDPACSPLSRNDIGFDLVFLASLHGRAAGENIAIGCSTTRELDEHWCRRFPARPAAPAGRIAFAGADPSPAVCWRRRGPLPHGPIPTACTRSSRPRPAGAGPVAPGARPARAGAAPMMTDTDAPGLAARSRPDRASRRRRPATASEVRHPWPWRRQGVHPRSVDTVFLEPSPTAPDTARRHSARAPVGSALTSAPTPSSCALHLPRWFHRPFRGAREGRRIA